MGWPIGRVKPSQSHIRNSTFFREFDGIVVSGDEKMIKPGNEIYQLLLRRYQLVADESLFIDDNIDNIIAAKVLGFQTIHLSEQLNLKDELERLRIL